MPGEPPPPRYRIYERNRRLVVIDQWASASVDKAESPQKQGKLNRVAFDGRTGFTTHPLFDTKGPRTIILDPGSAQTVTTVKVALVVGAAIFVMLAFVTPYLLLPLIILLQRRFREQIRAGATAWLDRAANTNS